MRVIGGTSRGRVLKAPGGPTRPTGDRVREAIFDMLGSMAAVAGSTVLDLFAGSGAMGIEALSRGASSAVFVDDHPAAVAAVRANLEATGLDGAHAPVHRAEVLRWLERQLPGAAWDIAFVDPPYAFCAWPALLERLRARLAVLESDRPLDPGGHWEVLKHRRYGGTLVTVIGQAARNPPDVERGTC